MTKETQHVSDDATAMDLHYMGQNFTLLQSDPSMDLFGDQGTIPTLFPAPIHSTASRQTEDNHAAKV